MISQLTPEQVAKHWDIIKYGVERALPPIVNGSRDRTNNILAALLDGSMQAWTSFDMLEDGTVLLDTIIVTMLNIDRASGTKACVIYAVYGYKPAPIERWLEGIRGIAKWAKAEKCSMIAAYSNNPAVLEKVEALGADTSYRFITFDIGGMIDESLLEGDIRLNNS